MRTVHFVSPAEPSGASWLLNCLLELGVRIGHKPCVDRIWRKSPLRHDSFAIWQDSHRRSRLNRRADILRKWLPALSRRDSFTFCADVAVEYLQDFPSPQHESGPVLFFIRDPRDALYSMYRRRNPRMSCAQFVRLPDPRTLLDRIGHWRLHVESWARLPNVRFLRFEDYKRDDRAVLGQALEILGIDAGHGSVAAACRESTFEKAAWGEAQYRSREDADAEVINRRGRVGDWRNHPEAADCGAEIGTRLADLLIGFGYEDEGFPHDRALPGRPQSIAHLDYCAGLVADMPSAAPETDRSIADLLEIADLLDEDILMRSRLAADEIVTLLTSMAEFLEKHRGCVDPRIARMRSTFADGGDYHFRQILELRKRMKKNPSA